MKPIKFLAQFQAELFPERSTVGHEVTAILLTAPESVSSPSTEVPGVANNGAGKMRQARLPIAPRWSRR